MLLRRLAGWRTRRRSCFTYIVLFVFTLLILPNVLYLINVGVFYKNSLPASSLSMTDIENGIVHEGCTKIASAEMQRRAEHIRNLCEAYHLGNFQHANGENDFKVKDPPTPQFSYFFLNRNKQLAWCPVYKAGSTSWLHNMMLIAGVSEEKLRKPPKQLSIWAREIYGDPEPDHDFENSVKMLIVRHPFSRILSAYLDKLSNSSSGGEHGTAHFYVKYGQHIVRNFRTMNGSIYVKEPTFEEFVRYLLSIDLAQYSDDHWLPVYYSCTPCRVQYDFIAKVETLTRDQACIIEGTRLTSVLKPRWKHKTSFKENESLISKYFSQLTKTQMMQLFEKYKLDFLLFGYSYSSYLSLGKD